MAAGGDVQETYAVGGRVLAVVDQVSEHTHVLGVDARTGHLDWDWRPGGHGLFGEQLVVDGRDLAVMIGEPRSELVVIDGSTGRVRWRAPAARAEINGIATAPGIVLGSWSGTATDGRDGTVIAFAAATGAVLWRKDMPSDDLFNLVEERGTIAGPTTGAHQDDTFLGIDLETGKNRWALPMTDKNVPGAMSAVRDAFLLSEQFDSRLTLIDPATGKVRWTASGHGEFDPDIHVAADSALYSVENDGDRSMVVSRDLGSGRTIATARLNDHVVGGLTVAGDSVVVAGDTPGSWAVTLWSVKEGTVRWSLKIRRTPPPRGGRGCMEERKGPTGLSDGGAVIQVSTVFRCGIRLLPEGG